MSPSWPDSSGFCGGFTTASVAQSWRRACTSSAMLPANWSAASRSCRSWRRRSMYAPPALCPSSSSSKASGARSRAADSSAARSTVSLTPHSWRSSSASSAAVSVERCSGGRARAFTWCSSAAFSRARLSSSTACASARASTSGARRSAQCRSSSGTARLLAPLLQSDSLLESLEALPQLLVLALELLAVAPVALLEAMQRRIGLPPVDAHLSRAVDRRDQQPQLDRQQLYVEQVDLDVARDHDALVEHPLEDVRKVGAFRGPSREAAHAAARYVGTLHRYSSSAWPRTNRLVRL